VRLVALPSGQEIAVLVGHKRDVFGLCFSPDGRTLATLSDDGTLRLWHVATRRELIKFDVPRSDPVGGELMFSPDGRTLVAHIRDRHQSWTRLWFGPMFQETAASPADGARP
jgi:WD40 repeat protein